MVCYQWIVWPMVGFDWKPSPSRRVQWLSFWNPLPFRCWHQWLCLNLSFNGNGSWFFYSKNIFQGRAYFPIWWNIHSSSNIKNKTSKESQNSFKWTQDPQRHQLSKCGPGCPEREEFPTEEVRPWCIRSSEKWRRWGGWSSWDGCQKLWSWGGW